MTLPNRRRLLGAALAMPFFADSGRLQAQSAYPNRPVMFVVPQPAGGGADGLCRTLQPKLVEQLGQPVVIENRGGAAGNIGTATGLAAPGDGYTLVFVNLSTMALNPYLYKKTGYSQAEMQPVILLANVANLIVVNPTKVSATTMREFIEQARRSPGKFTYASAGNGSGNHLGGAMLEKMAGIDLLHVPYKGGGPALTAVLSGEVDASVADPIAVLPHVKSGKLRALAVTSAARSSALPEVPTVAESGVPGYDAASWAGVAVRKDVPSDIVDRLYKAFSAALKSPDVAARLSERLYDPAGAGPQAFSTLIARENDKYARLIRQLDIQLD